LIFYPLTFLAKSIRRKLAYPINRWTYPFNCNINYCFRIKIIYFCNCNFYQNDYILFTGSAFTKTKPKHGFFTVARLAIVRLLFLPCYYRWYIHQTSWRLFLSLLCLYVLELANILLFSYITFVSSEEDTPLVRNK